MTFKNPHLFKRNADHQLENLGICWGRKNSKRQVMLFIKTCLQEMKEIQFHIKIRSLPPPTNIPDLCYRGHVQKLIWTI